MGNGAGIGWETKAVQPPAVLFLNRETFAFMQIRQSVVGATYVFLGRILMDTGQVIPFRYTLDPAADRSGVSLNTLQKVEGFLLGLVVGTASDVRTGQCYGRAGLAHGGPTSSIDVNVLLQGKISNERPLNYPPGLVEGPVEGAGILRSITGTDPAAGAEINETVPTNARWRVSAVRFTLVTSATAASRRPFIEIDDGTTILLRIGSDSDILASSTRAINAVANGSLAPSGLTESHIALPTPLYLLQGWRIRTLTASIQAADNYSAPQLLVEEWIEE